MPIASGLTVKEETGNGTVTELLTTSDYAFSKVSGYGLSTYEREEGDMDGPFALAVSIEMIRKGSLSGLRPPVSWRICTMPHLPEPTAIWE